MRDQTLSNISKNYLFIDSFETDPTDSLDFHAVAGIDVHAALTAAYLAGYAAAVRAADGSTMDALPTERHTMLGGVWLGEGEARNWSIDPLAETVITAPIPEVAFTAHRGLERRAWDLLIPTAIRQRRIA